MSEEKGTAVSEKKGKRSEKRQRQNSLHLRLSDAEDARLREMAFNASFEQPGDLLRAWIHEKRVKAIRKHPDDYYWHIRQIVDNLNQITKKLNVGQVVHKREIEKMTELCERVIAIDWGGVQW